MGVQKHIANIKTLRNEIFELGPVYQIDNKEGKLYFWFSYFVNGLDGIRVSLANGEIWALKTALYRVKELMEIKA